jgi:uncharacterized protein
MNRDRAISILKDHAVELQRLGVVSVSLFGSTARDDATDGSDVDIAVHLAPSSARGLAYLGRLEDIKERLAELLGAPVDLIAEPTARRRLQQAIDRDRCRAF